MLAKFEVLRPEDFPLITALPLSVTKHWQRRLLLIPWMLTKHLLSISVIRDVFKAVFHRTQILIAVFTKHLIPTKNITGLPAHALEEYTASSNSLRRFSYFSKIVLHMLCVVYGQRSHHTQLCFKVIGWAALYLLLWLKLFEYELSCSDVPLKHDHQLDVILNVLVFDAILFCSVLYCTITLTCSSHTD